MHNKHSKIKRASLNHTYRLVWSDAKQMYIAVAEIAPGKGKRKGGIVGAIAALMMGFGGIAHALDPGTLPEGANITHGQAQIQQHNNVMTIQQTSDKLITNWNSFNIGQDATVNFQQPNSNSAALNRVMDNNPSQIHGRLNANGNVYLVNPSGILFGKTAQVDVGGLIASTLEISDQDFLDNKLDFKNLGFSEGDIKNLGHIRANGGVVALIANRVSNQGTIEANNGNVALAAGDHVTLDFNGDGLMTVTVEQGVLDALAENGGLIQADGGFVIMTTQARQDIYRNLVNNDGLIQAQTLANKSGRIMLMGGMTQGQVTASGKLDASAPETGDGGFIETSAAKVDIQPGLVVTTKAETGKTGEWLIDPNDYTIAESGGDITGTQLGDSLANNNVTIQSVDGATDGNGDIFVNDAILWSADTTLTLNSHRNILINNEITASGTNGKVALFYGQGADANGNEANYDFGLTENGFTGSINLQAGQNFITKLGSNGAEVIWTVITAMGSQGFNTQNNPADGLQTIPMNTTGNFALGANIDATETKNWTSGGWVDGYLPINFHGHFDGLGHTISHLYIRSNSGSKGLFGYTDGASIKNIGVTNIDFAANSNVGGVVGDATNSTIDSVFSTGTITLSGGNVGTQGAAGGLLGTGRENVIIKNSHSSVNVEGRSDIGGLAGSIFKSSSIENSFATGEVKVEGWRGGGLAGFLRDGSRISDSYATGDVIATGTATDLIGGIAGSAGNIGSTVIGGVSNSYYLGTLQGEATNKNGTFHTSNSTNASYYPITNTFYDRDKNPGLPDAILGKTTAQITNLGYYVDPCETSPGMPSCGTVVNGNGTIGDIDGNNLTINQTASKLIIDWKQFDIAAGNTVHFDQQGNASWVALNRVIENNPSQILGNLTADGRVYLVNPSGILFGANAQVNVAGLVASNLQINEDAFNNGTLNFADTTGNSFVSIQDNTANWEIGTGGLTLASSSDFVVGADAPSVTESGISATALQNRLNASDVELHVQTGGGSGETGVIDLNAAIVWNANNALTLKADTINVNARIANTSNNDGGVRFNAANTSDKVVFTNEGLVEIYNINQLQRINQALAGRYALGEDIDIDASDTSDWNSGAGWKPIGDNTNRFSGSFDGQGNTLSNLTINRISEDNIGLFGSVDGATISNIGLDGGSIKGGNSTGALIGVSRNTEIIQTYSTLNVEGERNTGGLVGFLTNSTITNSYAAGDVTASGNNVGGLVGYLDDSTIANSYAAGDVVAGHGNFWVMPSYVGGLVGFSATIHKDIALTNVYATGKVTGTGSYVGGLIGAIDGESINSRVVSATAFVTNAYAAGAVSGAKVAGSNPETLGGLIGGVFEEDKFTLDVTKSFWDTETTDQATSAGGEGKTASEMRTSSTFTDAGWNTDIWSFTVAGQGAAVAGYEFGGGLPYLTHVTRVEDRDTPTILFAGGWGGADDKSAYTIENWNQLQNINLVLDKGFDFLLSNNLTTETDGYAEQASATANNAAGWKPIGDNLNRFSGSFDGQGNTLSNLTINRTSGNNIGLFGFTMNTGQQRIENLVLEEVNIKGNDSVGGLIGEASGTHVENITVSGSVTGNSNVGGLVGTMTNAPTSIVRSSSSAVVEGSSRVGGLVGELVGSSVRESYATGKVTGSGNDVGGLVGYTFNSSVTESYATGAVKGNDRVGGLIGHAKRELLPPATISNTYATGSVEGNKQVGGLVGLLENEKIENSYAIGPVTGDLGGIEPPVGGLVGEVIGFLLVKDSFWDWETTGITSGNGMGKGSFLTTEMMKDASNFAAWNTNIWSFPAAGQGAAVAGYEYGDGGLPYLTQVTRVEDRDGGGEAIILFAGGWGDAGGDGAYTISNWNQLQNINLVVNKGFDFALSNDLTTSTEGYAEQVKAGDVLANEGTGWTPIGDNTNRFSGSFDGQGNTLSNLTINRSSENNIGLFGSVDGATISNIGLDGGSIKGGNSTGALIGASRNAEITQTYSTLNIEGVGSIGGLVGFLENSTITNSYAAGDVTASSFNVGGLVGYLDDSTITNSYAAGDVVADHGNFGVMPSYAGGLVGFSATNHKDITLTNVYATGKVTGSGSYVGGLIGFIDGESINSSVVSATASVTNAYATGVVSGAKVAGSDPETLGGLIGGVFEDDKFTLDVTKSFWDTETTGQATSAGGEGKTTVQMKEASTFAGWDISSVGGEDKVWRIYEGHTAPLLRSFLTPLTLAGTPTVDKESRVYDATTDVTVDSSVLTWSQDGQAVTPNDDWVFESGYRLDGKNVGQREVIGGFYSSQLGYDIIDQTSKVTVEITKADLKLTGLTAQDKVYDATLVATLGGEAGVAALLDDQVSLSGTATGAFDDKHVAQNKVVNISGLSLSGEDAGNYTLVLPSNLTANISAKPITISGISAQDRVYNRDVDALVDVTKASGWITGDQVTVSATGVFDNKSVGENKTVTLTSQYKGADASNYIITDQATTSASITPKAITISGITAADREYDGGVSADVDATNASGWIAGDDLTVSAIGTFDNKNVGVDKEVTINSKYSGEDVGNYSIVDQTTTTANITAKELVIKGLTAENRTYDGSRVATIVINGVEYAGLVKDDDVSISATGEFDDKNVGVDKEVTITSKYSGADVGNYKIVDQTETSANITAKELVIKGLTAENRTYDGSRVATIVINGVEYAGLVENDEVNISATGEFDDKNVGENKTVTITSDYSGADVDNYSIVDQTTTTANITAKQLVIKGLTAENRIYDGGRVATIVIDGVEYAGLVENDEVNISATGEFDDKNVGVDKEVTITSIYSGADLGNYKITNQTSTTATITAKELIISGLAAEGKVYDGSKVATILINGVEFAGLIGKDDVKVSATGEFADKNVGENKTVSITSEYSGADINNYSIVDQTSTTANITAKELLIKGLTAENRTYDGSRVATIVINGVEYAGLVKDDDVKISASGEFDDKNVGVDKEVTITSTYSGADVGNYTIQNQTTTTANITAKELVIKGLTAENRTYDGSRVATIVIDGVEYAGLVGNDEVNISATGEFADKNVGENKTVTITSEYSGADLGNYKITNQATTTATITAKDLIISGLTAEGKVYDGNRIATIVIDGVQYAGLVENDEINISATGEFADKNVGENKTVSITSEYSGADVNNYNIQNQATTTASITAKDLIIRGLTAEGKVYDGNRIATIVIDGVQYAGLVENDEVNISASGEFDNKNVGENKTVTITSDYSGADVNNYTIQNQATTMASITPKGLTISGMSAEDKFYDGNTRATLLGGDLVGVVAGERLSFTGQSGQFASLVIGPHDVSVSGLSLVALENADINNYTVSIPEYIRATINPQAGTDTGAQQRDTVVNVPAAQTPVLTPAPSLVSDTRAADVVADAVPAPVAAEPAAVETFAVEALDVEAQDVETLAAEPIALEPVAAEPVEVETVEVETVEAETVEVETVEVETVEVETVEAETVAAEPVAVIDQPAVRSSSVSINGETVALNFSQTAEVATLEVGDASMATDEVIQPGLAIYESSGGTTRLDSVVDISDRGNSVSATAGSADTAQASIEMSSPVVEQTSISLTNEEGVEETMDVSMLEDGTLVIDLPANASVSDSRQATLMGVAAAKRAGVSVDRLKAVVINRR